MEKPGCWRGGKVSASFWACPVNQQRRESAALVGVTALDIHVRFAHQFEVAGLVAEASTLDIIVRVGLERVDQPVRNNGLGRRRRSLFECM